VPPPCTMTVLIAHADPLISAGLAATLREQRGFEVVVCSPESVVSRSTVRPLFSPDVVVADCDSGLRLTACRSACGDRVMILTHNDSESKICQALQQGARGYLLLGCSLQELMDGLRSIRSGGIALGALVVMRIADSMKHEALSRREEDILAQVVLGLSNKSIAAKLALAVETVKTHLKSILRKLDAANRTEAAAIAQRRGILQEQSERPDLQVRRPGCEQRAGTGYGGRPTSAASPSTRSS
jgi:DNA-binding NarL/FixJ family response regulator